jgi:tetratricopeptide (TPR) repeat protein
MGDDKKTTTEAAATAGQQKPQGLSKKIKQWFGDKDGNGGGLGSLVSNFNDGIKLAGLIGSLILLLVIALIQKQGAGAAGHPAVLLMIAAAAFGGGIIMGLMMTAFGEEKQMFSNLSAAFQGILGGFTLADLTKDDSVIKKILHALAAASGNKDDIGLTSAVVVFFGAAGFVTMFFNKQYLLNPLLAKSQETMNQLEKLRQLTKGIQLSDFPWESKLEISDEQKRLLETALAGFDGVLDDAELVRELPLETLCSYAKACRLLGEKAHKTNQPAEAEKRFQQAEQVLRRARGNKPDDADLLFELANVLLLQKRYDQAAAYYSYLTHLRAARVSTYRLLGYAGLFDFRYLAEAEAATRHYLCFVGNDAGAKLNLACAICQQSAPAETEAARREEACKLLREAIRDWPEAGPIAAGLTTGKGDFVKWKDEEEFKQIIGPFIKDNVKSDDSVEKTNPPPSTNEKSETAK